jgi:hypothetical protein
MQGVAFRISCKKPASIRSIEDKMPGSLADDLPTNLFQILSEGKIG